MQKIEIADNISDRIGNVFLQQLKESPDMDLWYQQDFHGSLFDGVKRKNMIVQATIQK